MYFLQVMQIYTENVCIVLEGTINGLCFDRFQNMVKVLCQLLGGTIMLLIVFELDGITSQTKRIGFCDGAMNSEAHHFFFLN